jgi:hypothetical protein
LDHDALLVLFRRVALASAPLLWGACTIGPSYNCTSAPDQQLIAPVASISADAGLMDGGIGDAGIDELCRQALPGYYRIKQCDLETIDGGLAVRVVYTNYCLGGRRPEGLTSPAATCRPSPVGQWLARAAHLEAASIDAFLILSSELDAHGAPAPLVAAARAAAEDERRHARVMGRLAVRHGSRPAPVLLTRRPTRDLESIARENAVEGCVRETFAALVAHRQGRAAGDPAIRRAMRGIAGDETRHAMLSFAVHNWSADSLGRAARRRVEEARREAGEALLREVALPQDPALRGRAGLPDADEAVRMASQL